MISLAKRGWLEFPSATFEALGDIFVMVDGDFAFFAYRGGHGMTVDHRLLDYSTDLVTV